MDDTDHFDGTGMEIRRNKIMLEISGIEALKIASAHELLSILEKFQRLSHKARKLHP